MTKEFEIALDKFMDELVDEIFSRSQENIVKNRSSDTGQLLKTANVNREFLRKEIVYPEEYAQFVEFGADPHEIPVREIANPRPKTRRRKNKILVPVVYDWTRKKLGKNDKEAVGVSWAIKKKIAREGTPAQPFLRPAIDATIISMGGTP